MTKQTYPGDEAIQNGYLQLPGYDYYYPVITEYPGSYSGETNNK
jgi:hypothetical protein